MPYDNPEPDDPNMLVGIALPGSEAATREMTEAFASEFAQLGFDRNALLTLFRDPFYAAAHAAWRLLGEHEIVRIVDESVEFWSYYRRVVHARPDEAEASTGLVRPGGFLRVLPSCPEPSGH